MHVTFVALGSEQLAVSLLSAVLRRAGHTTSLAFDPALFDDRYFLDLPPLARTYDCFDQVVESVVASEPDLVACSALTSTYQRYLSIVKEVKRRIDVPVLIGGVHPSAAPEACLSDAAVDYVCVGEGENAILRLCEVLPDDPDARPTEPIANLQWRDGGATIAGAPAPFLQDLDSLPHWDKGLWSDHVRVGDSWMTMAARGCPYRCTFCFNNYFAKLPGKGGGRYLRRRSVEHVLSELRGAKDRFGIRYVDFQDDIFTTDKAWLEEFCGRYADEIGVPFQCLVHPRYVDEAMAGWLHDAGCVHVQMGVQSADEEYKRKQLLRMEKEAHVERSLDVLAAAGVDVKLDHMLGLPGEPLSAQEKARELYALHTPRRIQTFWLTHLPGVELTKRAVAEGDLSEDDYDALIHGKSGRFHSRSASAEVEADTYRRYELLFRLLPLVPARFRSRLRVTHMPALPGAAAQAAGFVLEVANAVKNRDIETRNYLFHYAHQLRRQTPRVVRERRWRRRAGDDAHRDRADQPGPVPEASGPTADPGPVAVPVELGRRPSVTVADPPR